MSDKGNPAQKSSAERVREAVNRAGRALRSLNEEEQARAVSVLHDLYVPDVPRIKRDA